MQCRTVNWVKTLLGSGFLTAAVAFPDPADFEQQHQQALQKNLPGAVFTLRLKGDQQQFYLGETIPVELAFSTTLTNAYTLDAATYDRGGRLPSEQWHIAPAEFTLDPLAEYFAEGGMMGGLRSMPTLTEKPHLITLDLNEWVRFTQPGKYRVYDTSQRLINQHDPCGGQRGQPATSNIIDIEILPPNPEWSARTLREACQALDRPGRAEQRRPAARVLRFLDTAAAVHELVQRLGASDDDCQFEYHIGLYSSPHRERVLAEMEGALVSPDYPVTETFLADYARLQFLTPPPERLPAYPTTKNEALLKQWSEAHQARRDQQQQMLMKAWQTLTEHQSEKRGAARALSLATLLNVASNCSPKLRGSDWPQPVEKLRTELGTSFALLPPRTQTMLLEYRWTWIKSPALLPVLRQLTATIPGKDWQDKQRRNLALRRLYEIAPAEGRGLILEEICHPQPFSDPVVLSQLPDETLPALDEDLIQNLEKSDNNYEALVITGQLVGRYSSARVLERVRKVYDKGGKGWACDIERPLLRYFLRVAAEQGVDAVEKALTQTTTGCKHNLLTRLADPTTAALLEPLAIRHLTHPDPEVAADCAKFLRDYGSQRAEKQLLLRLRQFHEDWKDRADELCPRYGSENKHAADAQLESSLVYALGEGLHWMPDSAELREIERLCVTSNSVSPVRGWRSSLGDLLTGNPFQHLTITPSRWRYADGWRVAQYELKTLDDLKEKLLQFPNGTVFCWQESPSNDSENLQKDELAYQTLHEFLVQHGKKLEK